VNEATGGQWISDTDASVTSLIKTQGILDMDPDEIVLALVAGDSTLRNNRVLEQTMEKIEDQINKKEPDRKGSDDVLSGSKLKRSKEQLRY
jgi:hypothetical protein